MEDEQDSWDRASLSGQLSLHGIGTEQHKEGGGLLPGKRPNKEKKREGAGDMK